MTKIILASQSPRRRELLQGLGLKFESLKINVEEVYPQDLAPEKVPAFLAELKAKAHQEFLKPGQILITADTIVILNGEILGKPHDEPRAKEMLRKLSGKTHEVVSAVTISSSEKYLTKTDVAKVEFESLSEQEIDFYVNKYKPFDKAGAYGIQEWIGMAKIKKITGSYYTIMGLPTHLVYEGLKEF